MERSQCIELLTSYHAVLVPLKGKAPIPPGWQQLKVSHPDALNPNSDQNVGVVLGDASAGLVDIDIDDMEALALADSFLPETPMEFGRESKPRSHRIFRCRSPGKTNRIQRAGETIVELRGNGGQTMFPPSVHPNGEHIEFAKTGEPAQANWNDLLAAVTELAIATGISRFYRQGSRHDIAYALSGFLRRCGWPQDRTEKFIEKLTTAFQDNDVNDRLRCVSDAYVAVTPMGRNKLSELTDDEFVASASKWLKYQASKQDSPGVGSLECEADCAREFVAEYADSVIFDDLAEQFYRKNHGVHVPVSGDVIRGLIQDMPDTLASKFAASSLTKFKSAAGVKNITNLARPRLIADRSSFDTDHTLLGAQNGIVDLKTKTLLTDSHSIVTKRALANFNPTADCPNFRAFFQEIMGGDLELMGYVRRVLGYGITGYTGEQVCFIAIGGGANGKSTFFSVVHKVLGDYAGNTPMQTLMQSKFGDQNTYDLAALEGKRFVLALEGEASSKLAEAKLKSMTGGDTIACRPIYGKPRTYYPQFKIVLITNEMPNIDGVDEAIWRRIKVIPFNVTIAKELRDPYLKEKLLKESDGILNFLVECFQEYDSGARSNGEMKGLWEPEIVANAIASYRTEADSVGVFIKAKCQANGNGIISTKELYFSYMQWCSDGGIDPLSKSYFGRNLAQKGFESRRAASGNCWKGITLKDDVSHSCGLKYQGNSTLFENAPQ